MFDAESLYPDKIAFGYDLRSKGLRCKFEVPVQPEVQHIQQLAADKPLTSVLKLEDSMKVTEDVFFTPFKVEVKLFSR